MGADIPNAGPMSPPAWNAPQPQQQSWQPPPPPGYGSMVKTPQQGLAIASMIVALVSMTLGWICLGTIEGIAAVIMGVIALVLMNNDPKKFGGKTFAWVGIGVGAARVILMIAFYIIYFVIYGATQLNR
jgi:Domain of unknown function (DUF4190)